MNEKQLTKSDWFKSLAEECDSLITETIFTSRFCLIEGYHQVGKIVLEAVKKYQVPITKLVQDLAVKIEKSERTLFYAVKLYETYPKLDQLPEGKNISWNKLINGYLSEPKEKENKIICKHCPIHCRQNGNI